MLIFRIGTICMFEQDLSVVHCYRSFLHRRKYLWFTQKKTVTKDHVQIPENVSICFFEIPTKKAIIRNDPEKAVCFF